MIERPPLRYLGGKWKLGPWILEHFPAHRVYVEPFAGGASLLLRKAPSESEYLNDAHRDVFNFWRVLRDDRDHLTRAIDLTPFSRAELRLSFEPAADPLEQARRTYVRSWQAIFGGGNGHASGWRVSPGLNRHNNPQDDWRQPEGLAAVSDRLRNVGLECGDALQVLRRFDRPHTLAYVDPPYLRSTRGARTTYAVEFDSEAQHRALADALRDLRGMVVLSGHPSALYAELYELEGWQRYDHGHHTGANTRTTESIWLNPAAIEARRRAGGLQLCIPTATEEEGEACLT